MSNRPPSPRPTRTPRFPGRNLKTEPCPDCGLRNALSRTTLRPIHDRDPFRRRLYRRSAPINLIATVVDGCMACGGSGYVPRSRPGDPYEHPN